MERIAARWLLVRGRDVRDLFVYSSTYIAVITALEVIMVMDVLDLPPNPAPVVVGLITFTIYASDRLVDVESDGPANPGRTAFVRRYRRPLSGLAAIAYGIAVALSATGGPIAFGLALFPAVIWVLYAVDWAPANAIPFQRMKEVLIVNSTLVAVAWASTVVFLPVVFVDAPFTPVLGTLFVYFAIGTFISAEVANVNDVETDRTNGIATLPSRYGIRKTRRALSAIVVSGFGLLGYAWMRGQLGDWSVAALAVGLVCILAVVSLVGRFDDDRALAIASEYARLPVLAVLIAAPLTT
ncbi:MAG: UbiA family prenyltransferase [Haloarculaceae archaeon]